MDSRSGSVIAKEIEKEGIPVGFITAMTLIAQQMGVNRVITAGKIPHPCGDPNLPPEADKGVRRAIVMSAVQAVQTDVAGPTVFVPKVAFTSG